MLNRFILAYLHILESKPSSGIAPVAPLIRDAYKGTLINNGGYDQKSSSDALAAGEANAIAFGTPFIANPDIVNRFKNRLPLAAPDPDTFYTAGPVGYTDYPFAQSRRDSISSANRGRVKRSEGTPTPTPP